MLKEIRIEVDSIMDHHSFEVNNSVKTPISPFGRAILDSNNSILSGGGMNNFEGSDGRIS